MTRHRHFLPAVLLLGFASVSALASPPRLDLIGYTCVWGGSCQRGQYVIAGSPFFVKINNTVDQPQALRKYGWPTGYVLEAALDLSPSQDFVPTSGLMERLQPTPFLSVVNIANQWDLEHNEFHPADLEALNLKHFALHIPADLAGHRLTLRSRCNVNGFSLTSGLVGPIEVITPCDRSDTSRIVAIQLFEAWVRKDDERAIEIADSMLACGLSDAEGWVTARSAAQALHRPEKSLAYLDRLYQDFGTLYIELGTTEPPRFDPQGARDSIVQQQYEHKRNSALQAIARQQRRDAGK
jgi:hypothetical protein